MFPKLYKYHRTFILHICYHFKQISITMVQMSNNLDKLKDTDTTKVINCVKHNQCRKTLYMFIYCHFECVNAKKQNKKQRIILGKHSTGNFYPSSECSSFGVILIVRLVWFGNNEYLSFSIYLFVCE